MILHKTAFILGAGASCNYGLPTGAKLRDEVLSTLAQPPEGLIKGSQENAKTARMLHDSLSAGNLPSIEAFLEGRRSKQEIELAKKCMAYHLGNHERMGLRYINGGWYTRLWQKMYAGANADPGKMMQNKVCFITFNYDRSLEFFLEKAIRAAFGEDEQIVTALLNQFIVVHVHGQLGRLPWQKQLMYLLPEYPYAGAMDWNLAEAVQPCIRLMNENTAVEENLQRARILLSQAEKICFLGFGYRYDDLERLSNYPVVEGQKVLGTYFRPQLQVPPEISRAETNGFNRNIEITPLCMEEQEALSSYIVEVAGLI